MSAVNSAMNATVIGRRSQTSVRVGRFEVVPGRAEGDERDGRAQNE